MDDAGAAGPAPSVGEKAPSAAGADVPKVLYVMGAGRSGSTILGITLGNCPGILYAGELDKWLRTSGKPVHRGERRERFWLQVREQIEIPPALLGRAARCLEQTSAPFRPGTWRLQRRLREPYRRFSEDLYRTVARVAGVTGIVDTSHFPRRARQLQRLSGIELYLLLIVRDPHSVVASWDRDDVVEPRFNLLASNAYLWLTHLLSAYVFLRHPRERRLLVRHESFVEDPERVLGDILARVGSAARMPDFTALDTGVVFKGNRMARPEVVALRRGAPSPAPRSLLTTLLQLPWKIVFARLGPVAGAPGRSRTGGDSPPQRHAGPNNGSAGREPERRTSGSLPGGR